MRPRRPEAKACRKWNAPQQEDPPSPGERIAVREGGFMQSWMADSEPRRVTGFHVLHASGNAHKPRQINIPGSSARHRI